jgi:K+-sensing histidine kinase KdpD
MTRSSVVRLAALALPLLSCAALSLVRDDVPAATAVLVQVLWVVAAAATGDRIAAVLAALSGAVWFDFFLTVPYHSFTINHSDDVEAAILLVVIGLAVSEIALWGYRQQAGAARRSGYLDGVVGAARAVAEGGAALEIVAAQIRGVLDADEARFVPGPVHDGRIAVLDHDGVLTRGGRPVDVDRVGLPVDEYVAVPVLREGRVVGHFLVTATSHVSRPSAEQRRVAALLADQVAVALES